MFVLISKYADKKILDVLKKEGLKPILLDEFQSLQKEVSSHADMLFFEVDGKVFSYADYELNNSQFDFVKIHHRVSPIYPNDVGLNILKVGKNIFARLDSVSSEVADYLLTNKYILNDVKQGYAHCSTLVLNDNAIITSDKSIEKSAKNLGIDVLFADNKNIKLKGLTCGFIGGASLKINNKILFFGDIKDIENYGEIISFTKKYGFSVISVDNVPLSDYGGALII